MRSKQAGELVQCERPKTLADGLRGRMGDLTWPIVRDFVDDVITVSEEEIIDAMQLCFERMKVWSCLRYLALNKMACSFCAGRSEPTSMRGLTSVSDTTPKSCKVLHRALSRRAHHPMCCALTMQLPMMQKASQKRHALQLVVEPSGAVGLAAALTETFKSQDKFQHKRIGIILCGGNVDLAAMGLWKQLRAAVLKL